MSLVRDVLTERVDRWIERQGVQSAENLMAEVVAFMRAAPLSEAMTFVAGISAFVAGLTAGQESMNPPPLNTEPKENDNG